MQAVAGPPDHPLYRVARFILRGTLAPLYRLRVTGTEHVPKTGAVVLASNHISNIDPLFVGTACPREVRFMAKAELWKVAPFGWFLHGLGAFPIRRGEADREAVRVGLKIVESGGVLGIFPEGHRQRSGRLAQAQPGVGLFSTKDAVVTIPVVIAGSNRIIRNRRLHFPRVSVTFGPPVDLSVAPGEPRAERHREAGRTIMLALAGMLGREWTAEAEPRRAMKGAR